MEIEDIEDVYNLTIQAQQVKPFLSESTYRFENYVDDFYHSDSSDCDTEGHYVSEGMIAHEAAHFADVIETHEEILEDLREAVDYLPECKNHRFIDGTRVRKDSLETELRDLIDDYREDFNEVIRVCGKTAVEEDLPGPQEVRSKRNRRKAQREAVSERKSLGVFQKFFSD